MMSSVLITMWQTCLQTSKKEKKKKKKDTTKQQQTRQLSHYMSREGGGNHAVPQGHSSSVHFNSMTLLWHVSQAEFSEFMGNYVLLGLSLHLSRGAVGKEDPTAGRKKCRLSVKTPEHEITDGAGVFFGLLSLTGHQMWGGKRQL